MSSSMAPAAIAFANSSPVPVAHPKLFVARMPPDPYPWLACTRVSAREVLRKLAVVALVRGVGALRRLI